MTSREQTHIDSAYANVKTAMDELAQVLDKDKYQCISNQKKRRA